MVNIDDFFKSKGKITQKRKASDDPPPSKKAKVESPKRTKQQQPEIIDLDDDDDFEFSDDDDEIIEITKPATPKKRTMQTARKSATTSPVKMPQLSKPAPSSSSSPIEISSPVTPMKSPRRTKQTARKSPTKSPVKPASSSALSQAISADDILATIPDAILPKIDENEKINFFALNAQRQANSGMGATVELPEAQPNCLSGLTIVFTGQMPNLDRDTAEMTAKRYGAKVTKSISGKTSLVVIGHDAGPSKVKKIEQLNIKAIDEAGFIELLNKMPIEGGSGELAQKAKLKREEEERKIMELVEEEERKEREEEERRIAAQKKATVVRSVPEVVKPASTPPVAATTGMSADEILATIPDAELPDVDDSKKVNFFALNAQKQANQTMGGTVELPDAQPNCLSGLTIVFTGQMPTLDRDTAEMTAKKYGAKVTKSISGKTSLVVIGQDAGPSKVKKIKQLKIKAIDEAGYIELLTKMPVEGGSGELAQKARLKREEEERKILEQVEEEEQKEQAAEAKRIAEQKKNATPLASSSGAVRPPPSVGYSSADIPAKDKLWTDKHAPTSISQLCGNKGQVAKLRSWLSSWFDNAKNGFKSKNGEVYRAALISGPPGIGKTTAAHLVAKELGFDVLEQNASDVRSKKLLNEKVKSILSNTSVVGFFKHRDDVDSNANSKKFCLIMDEVDGMSSGDHGGAGALSQFCRITHMPIILICNDKSLPKMRTFDRVTLDLPFRRPSETEVKSRLMAIAFREHIKLDPNIIGNLVQATSSDIRQMINLLSTVSKTQQNIGANSVAEISQSWKKQVILKPFDIAARLLSSGIWNAPNHSLNDKLDLYFNDIDFAPLMIQENYLQTNTRLPGKAIEHVAQAADDISISDSINSLIRSSEQQWSLLPFHGLMSTVKPSYEVAGNMTGRLNFSGWLGQNSKQMKFQRMLQEIQYHTRIKTSTTKQELRLDYLPVLYKKVSTPLKSSDFEGAIEVMDEYFLTKEDLDNIGDMLKQEIKLDSKAKGAFTRAYNSAVHPTVIYKTGNSVLNGGRKAGATAKVDYEDVVDDDMEDIPDEEVETDSIDTKKDKLIKVATKPKRKATSGGGAAKKKQKR
ncbi:rfc1 [[Candida] subhashii]|uniref:Replication factor C subunit 1 n=1 Tax=[Candida] subhashii TaxID=561895 RepID=A0A8J5QP28_9ASCO|nr:rfc1 [[Candida] subhashii]KAG7663930.1 rfc1 [[Candida] subhashii]